ncbi:MAG: DinB family protein [Chitinophagales bacterium]|nr:DinB family protein [Chitinophagales bacterium]
MKKFIKEYVAYNFWANKRLCDIIDALNDEQLNKEMVSSFPTIKKMLLHIWDAQDIWMERFDGLSPATWPSSDFNGSKKDLIAGVLKSSELLNQKVLNYSKKDLKQEVAYTTMKGNSGKSPVYEMLAHVVNHGSYHRGQLISMLRAAGITDLPATDLIAYLRENKINELPLVKK